jgi:hypothetical protein
MRCLGAKSIAAEAGNQANRLENAGVRPHDALGSRAYSLNCSLITRS